MYLAVVLRQDVEYFDLKAAGLQAEVIASVSNVARSAATFLGSYAVGFAILWHLTLVALPPSS
jgi:ATP-binding cassette subfamily B (MDR/TAP) protein 1